MTPVLDKQSELAGVANQYSSKVADAFSSLSFGSVGVSGQLDKAVDGSTVESDLSRGWSSATGGEDVPVVVAKLECPVRMMQYFIGCGLAPVAAGKIVSEYLQCYSKAADVSLAVVGSQSSQVAAQDAIVSVVSSRSSRRRQRRDGYKRTCDAMVWEDGMCYLKVVAWSRRVRLSRDLGPRPLMSKFLSALREGDLDVSAAKQHYVLCVSDAVGAQVYHIAASFGQRDVVVGTVHEVISTLVRIFPGCIQFAFDCVGSKDVAVVPLVAVVGADVDRRVGPSLVVASVDPVVNVKYTIDLYDEVDVSVPVDVVPGFCTLLVSDCWFQLCAGVAFTPVIYDYGATRALLVKEPGNWKVRLRFAGVHARAVQLVVPDTEVCNVSLVVALMLACGVYVGAAEQLSDHMWQDFASSESRIPLVPGAVLHSPLVNGLLNTFVCDWRGFAYLALLPYKHVLRASLRLGPVVVADLRKVLKCCGSARELGDDELTVLVRDGQLVLSTQPFFGNVGKFVSQMMRSPRAESFVFDAGSQGCVVASDSMRVWASL